jgi:hypothetical protein
LVFEKNANFFAENCRKSQKIVIITSTPGNGSWVWVSARLQCLHVCKAVAFNFAAHFLNEYF